VTWPSDWPPTVVSTYCTIWCRLQVDDCRSTHATRALARNFDRVRHGTGPSDIRTSLSSVRFLSIIGTPYAVVVSSHWCNNAPFDTIREGKSGNTTLLGGCCGGGRFSARPYILKDGLCIGVGNGRAPGGSVCVPELLYHPSDAPISFLDVLHFGL